VSIDKLERFYAATKVAKKECAARGWTGFVDVYDYLDDRIEPFPCNGYDESPEKHD